MLLGPGSRSSDPQRISLFTTDGDLWEIISFHLESSTSTPYPHGNPPKLHAEV
jgi:hypothetical protein